MTSAAQEIDVSVVVPAWKAGGFIGHAIASALASTGVSLEVIVVDDGSPDNTWQTLQNLAAADPRIRIDRLPANRGPSGARNRAIELAEGRWVAILDADDAMEPGRLASLTALGEASGADIVVDNMTEVDTDDNPIADGRFLKSASFQQQRQIDLETWVAHNQPMTGGDCLGYLKPVFRRASLVSRKARYDERLRNSEDYYLVANLLADKANMIYAPTTGYHYRRSAGSTSHRLAPAHTEAWLIAEQEFRAKFANGLTAAEQRVLSRRNSLLRAVDQLVRSLDAIRRKRIGTLARTLAKNPSAWPFTFRWFTKIGFGKITRRSAT